MAHLDASPSLAVAARVSPVEADDGTMAGNAAAVTCRYTAGLRFVEATQVAAPLLTDPLAGRLAGDAGLALARKELEDLSRDQGPGKHLRVPARSRIIDDQLITALRAVLEAAYPSSGGSGQQQVDTHGAVHAQVVSIGCGMCTRPWRMADPLLRDVAWFDVDFPVTIHLKRALLQEAGAQTSSSGPSPSTASSDAGSAAAAGGAQSHREGKVSSFPLAARSWTGVPLDLSQHGLRDTMLAAGLDPSLPTVWIAEAVLYYMPLERAEAALREVAALSAQHSMLLATIADAELLAACRKVENNHVFANLWHFDVDEFVHSGAFEEAWRIVEPPATTKALAMRMYGADTYVALYGGSECFFSAVLIRS